MTDTLADRLRLIISEQGLTKREFAKRIGVGETYVYVVTGGGRKNQLNQNISPALARVIGMEFGYEPEWILYGETAQPSVEKLRQAALEQVKKLSAEELLSLNDFLKALE